jgi:hypothetical protein
MIIILPSNSAQTSYIIKELLFTKRNGFLNLYLSMFIVFLNKECYSTKILPFLQLEFTKPAK